MKALRFSDKLEFVHDAAVPDIAGETLVQVICAGICSTDLEITRGYAGFTGTPGHEFVGRVVESPRKDFVGARVVGEINVGCSRCDLCRAGDSRHCASRTVLGIKGRDGAFAEYLSLPDRNLLAVPDSLADEEAVFVEPVAAALNVLDQIDLTSDPRVAVLGDGKLAQLIVRVLASAGCRPVNIGKHPEKLELSRKSGAEVRLVDDGLMDSNVFDVVIESTGSPSGLQAALDIVKPRGSIVLKSTHHGASTIDMSRVVVNEIHLIGSRCGRFAPAIDLLVSGAVSVSDLVSNRFSLDDGIAAFEEAASPEALKVILRVSD